MSNTPREDAGAPQNEYMGDAQRDAGTIGLLDIVVLLVENLKLLIFGPLAVGLVALGITYLITPVFTARTTFLPPQQQQGMAASTLASLGALAGIAGGAGVIKSPADQYVALMQSITVQDRLIDQYGLMGVYDSEYRFEARKELQENTHIGLGKKDGLITVEFDDEDSARAAAVANSYVDELRRLTNVIAITEAQQRRVFFQQQLARSNERLTRAQQALQASGFDQGALKAEPQAAADSYAKLKAEVTAAEVRLQAMRSYLSDSAPELREQQARLLALRRQLQSTEQAADSAPGPDYIGKYREFKYEEALFELFARQFEMARVDESREGALIQVVDAAQVPEWKSRPRRTFVAVASTMAALVALVGFLLLRKVWQLNEQVDGRKHRLIRIRAALGLH